MEQFLHICCSDLAHFTCCSFCRRCCPPSGLLHSPLLPPLLPLPPLLHIHGRRVVEDGNNAVGAPPLPAASSGQSPPFQVLFFIVFHHHQRGGNPQIVVDQLQFLLRIVRSADGRNLLLRMMNIPSVTGAPIPLQQL